MNPGRDDEIPDVGDVTDDGQEVIAVVFTGDAALVTVYTPRPDDADADAANMTGPETRVYPYRHLPGATGIPSYANGAPIQVGDRVTATGIDYGAPTWAGHGTVVKVNWRRVGVEWDNFSYDDRGPHMTYPHVLSPAPA